MSLAEELGRGLKDLGLDLGAEARQRLLEYVVLLNKWNRVYNLTAVRDPQKMISQHILDSLAVVPYIRGARRIADVGSGAGLPGIPVALAMPDSVVVLLESSSKKAAFLRQACAEMQISNVEVFCVRVDEWQPEARFDVVISRAFSGLSEFVKLAGHLCASQGKMVAMKGLYPHEELAQLTPWVKMCGVFPLTVPGVSGKRHLVVLAMAER